MAQAAYKKKIILFVLEKSTLIKIKYFSDLKLKSMKICEIYEINENKKKYN